MLFQQHFPYRVFISLRRRADRRAALQPRLVAAGLADAKWFEAIESNIFRGDPRGFRTLNKRSVALGKRLALREAARRRAPSLLLLEDDVIFHPEFGARVEGLTLPGDWGIFFFGCQHALLPESVTSGVVRVSKALDHHAVAIRAEYFLAVRKAMRGGGKGARGKMHSDLLLSCHHQHIPTYAALPNLAWQALNYSDLVGKRYSHYDQATGKQRRTHKIHNLLERLDAMSQNQFKKSIEYTNLPHPNAPCHPIYRIWPGFVRSQKAFDSWQELHLINVPAVKAIYPQDLRSRERACSQAHANALRLFLATEASHCVVIEDDAILINKDWLSYCDFDYFIPFTANRLEIPGRHLTIRHGALPWFGAQAYVASRRFAEKYIPLLEAGGVTDVVNLEGSIGLRTGSFASNGIIHDNNAISMISEARRQRHVGNKLKAQKVGCAIKFKTKYVARCARSVSFCVLCKGRKHQLEQTLPENLELLKNKNAELVVVDYHSDDGLAEWIFTHFAGALADRRLQFFQLLQEIPFSIPIGKNFAHRLASKEIIINLDADNYIGDLWIAAQMLGKKEFLTCETFRKGCHGRMGLWRGDLEKLNGYDESFEAAGYHDIDLEKRALRMGLQKINWNCSRLPIQHGKAETVAFAGGGGKCEWLAMDRRNAARSRESLEQGRLRANASGLTTVSFRHNFRSIIAVSNGCFYLDAKTNASLDFTADIQG